METPKKLILDYSKWICGEGGEHQLGKGGVALLNNDGFMCCLGQWSIQCGAKEEEILNFGEPQEIKPLIPLFAETEIYEGKEYNSMTGEYEYFKEECGKISTKLALDCIGINDNTSTTPEQKIEALRNRLLEVDIELEVINKPNEN
jgi:hypothetical protein